MNNRTIIDIMPVVTPVFVKVSDSTTSNPSLKRKLSKTSRDENDQRDESGRTPTGSTSKPLTPRKNGIEVDKGSASLGKRKELDTCDVVKRCRLDPKKLKFVFNKHSSSKY